MTKSIKMLTNTTALVPVTNTSSWDESGPRFAVIDLNTLHSESAGTLRALESQVTKHAIEADFCPVIKWASETTISPEMASGASNNEDLLVVDGSVYFLSDDPNVETENTYRYERTLVARDHARVIYQSKFTDCTLQVDVPANLAA